MLLLFSIHRLLLKTDLSDMNFNLSESSADTKIIHQLCFKVNYSIILTTYFGNICANLAIYFEPYSTSISASILHQPDDDLI